MPKQRRCKPGPVGTTPHGAERTHGVIQRSKSTRKPEHDQNEQIKSRIHQTEARVGGGVFLELPVRFLIVNALELTGIALPSDFRFSNAATVSRMGKSGNDRENDPCKNIHRFQ